MDDLLKEIDAVKRALAELAYKGVSVQATLTYDGIGVTVIEEFDSDRVQR